MFSSFCEFGIDVVIFNNARTTNDTPKSACLTNQALYWIRDVAGKSVLIGHTNSFNIAVSATLSGSEC